MSTLEFTEADLDQAAAREYAKPQPEPKPFDPEAEAWLIARRHGLTVDDLLGKRRYAHVVAARKELYRVLRDRGWSTPAIGRFVGGRDHTTVLQQLGRLTGK